MASGLKKGQTNNPNGRPKGTGDKSTESIKSMVTELVSQGMDESLKKMKEIKDPVKYMDIISKFIQYVLPKNVDLTSKGESLDTTSMTTEELKERLRVLKDIDKEIERE